MTRQQEIREEVVEGMREILSEDLILCSITHESAPPHRDCYEDCGVLKDPLQGEKHKKCMDCWNEYIEGLILRLLAKQDSQGVVIREARELPEIDFDDVSDIERTRLMNSVSHHTVEILLKAGLVFTRSLIEEKRD